MQKFLKFKIKLVDSEPLVWRTLLILENSTFFDLHILIQDAMKWENIHLHAFKIFNSAQEAKDDELISSEIFKKT